MWDSGTGYSTAIVRKSIDGGTSWTESILPSAPGDRPALAIDPQTPSTLYAGTRGGLFKSIDGGISWTGVLPVFVSRSEEHTSELQSRLHLVCRLLLEKKKKERS